MSRYEELETVPDCPLVCVIMSFEPKMKTKRELAIALGNALMKVEQQLLENFQIELAMPVIEKLRSIVGGLDYSTHKKSIAIYVSPVVEKIFYLNMEVKETISVDNSFTIRDLIKSKKEARECLLLVLDENESKVYFNSVETMSQVFAHRAESVLAGYEQPHNGGASFSDKYLHHIDRVLDILLPSFKVPLFVIGSKKISEQFKNITTHASSVVEYIDHAFGNLSPQELRLVMQPFTNDWPKIRKENLRRQLMHAFKEEKAVTGIENVFRQAMHRQGHLLLVEKDYKYPSGYGNENELIHNAIHPYNQLSYINDAVDDIIEKVLEENGEVEFVDKDVLGDYGPIALIL